mmetsp:Transcript_65498/g.131734  ORF Transcript_65498/g.131734 Transcript_65498/m.131734 type:complete len:232 (-) Transcript_65498:73-768(-)
MILHLNVGGRPRAACSCFFKCCALSEGSHAIQTEKPCRSTSTVTCMRPCPSGKPSPLLPPPPKEPPPPFPLPPPLFSSSLSVCIGFATSPTFLRSAVSSQPTPPPLSVSSSTVSLWVLPSCFRQRRRTYSLKWRAISSEATMAIKIPICTRALAVKASGSSSSPINFTSPELLISKTVVGVLVEGSNGSADGKAAGCKAGSLVGLGADGKGEGRGGSVGWTVGGAAGAAVG